MAPYAKLALNASDAELGLPPSKEQHSSASTQASLGRRKGDLTPMSNRRKVGIATGALVVLVLLYRWTGGAVEQRTSFGPPPSRAPRAGLLASGQRVANASTVRTTLPLHPTEAVRADPPLRPPILPPIHPPLVAIHQLLTSAAPSSSYFDSLRSDVRYLTADSWSGAFRRPFFTETSEKALTFRLLLSFLVQDSLVSISRH